MTVLPGVISPRFSASLIMESLSIARSTRLDPQAASNPPDTILHGAAGLHALELRDDFSMAAFGNLVELEERSSADQLGDVIGYLGMLEVVCHLDRVSSMRGDFRWQPNRHIVTSESCRYLGHSKTGWERVSGKVTGIN